VRVEYLFESLPSRHSVLDGRHGSPDEADLPAFLNSPEKRIVAAGFMRISDPASRRLVVELINTIAEEPPA
jgi:hypothetical protein